MRIVRLTINRPITTLMAYSAAILMGVVAFFNLSIDLLPDITFPVLSIRTEIPGYLPEEVETIITRPVEEQVSTMNNVHSVRSTSSEGQSLVTIAFNLGGNMDYALAEVRERLNLIKDNFPEDAQHPVIIKHNPSEAPIVIISAHSGKDSLQLREMVENRIEQPLSRIDGVANIEIKGGRKREIVIEIDHGRLKSLEITIRQIADILKNSNLNFQVGSIEHKGSRLTSRAVGEFEDLSQIGNIAIYRTPQGSAVYLKDIAQIKNSYQREGKITRFQGEPRVMLYVQKESSANILNVADEIQTELERLKPLVAPDLVIETVYNQADFIKASIRRLRNEALLGGVLAMAIILLFLRNLKGLMIIATAIPISMLSAFSLMYFFGITLNVITLAGFTLGVGMLVDNSIVVLENIFKKRRSGLSGKESALAGTREVARAITSSTIAHIAVFLPVIFLQEKIRMLYSGLFITVSFTLFVSLVVALTLIPTFASRLNLVSLKNGSNSGKFYRWYRHTLIYCLKNRGKVILSVLTLFGISLLLIPSIGFEPTARMDRGEFTIVVRTPPGSSLSATNAVALKLEQTIQKTPEIKDVATEVSSETAFLRVRLVPEHRRLKTTRQVAEELRPRVTSLPHTQVYFDIERKNAGGNEVVVEVNGYDSRILISLAFEVKRRLLELKEISDVVIHQGNPKPELQVKVLHDKAGIHGLDASQIGYAIRSRITGPLPTEYFENGKEIDLRVRLAETDTQDLSILQEISIPVAVEGKKNVLVPLSEVSTFKLIQGMAEIHRKDRHRMVKISGETSGEDFMYTLAEVKDELDSMKLILVKIIKNSKKAGKK